MTITVDELKLLKQNFVECKFNSCTDDCCGIAGRRLWFESTSYEYSSEGNYYCDHCALARIKELDDFYSDQGYADVVMADEGFGFGDCLSCVNQKELPPKMEDGVQYRCEGCVWGGGDMNPTRYGQRKKTKIELDWSRICSRCNKLDCPDKVR